MANISVLNIFIKKLLLVPLFTIIPLEIGENIQQTILEILIIFSTH